MVASRYYTTRWLPARLIPTPQLDGLENEYDNTDEYKKCEDIKNIYIPLIESGEQFRSIIRDDGY